LFQVDSYFILQSQPTLMRRQHLAEELLHATAA